MSIGYCVGLAAAAVIWMGGKPSSGYLARIGPAPLRFQPPPKGPDVTAALPPLAMSDPKPVEEFLGPPAPTNAPVAVATVVEPAPAPAPVAVAPAEPIFSPQMLIQYFNSDGTNQNMNVLVPYQFTPPPAGIPAPPSRATYIK